MQELKKMNLIQVENGETAVENIESDHNHKQEQLDPCRALQIFLDRIPTSSIPGIKNSPVVALKVGDIVKDSIQLLYEKNVSGAPIADVIDHPDSDTTIGRFSDQHMGLIDFVSLVLWSLESHIQAKNRGTGKSSFFTMLEQSPEIGQTKLGELAKSFLWVPFFPVNLEDTLFHVLMLLSKHRRLQAVPVIEQLGFQVIGFVTQNAVIQSLHQASGLEWFDSVGFGRFLNKISATPTDSIADKALSEFCFESEERVILVYEDQRLAKALHILWENRIGAVAVLNRETEKIIGYFSNSNVYLLLDNDELLNNRKKVTMGEFIHMETAEADTDPAIERDLGALLAAGALCLRSSFQPRMQSPVIANRSNTLKQAMKSLDETKGSYCFIVDDSQRPTGVLTLRDIILQFAPHSGIHGGVFFESALEQTGCQVKNGTIICDH